MNTYTIAGLSSEIVAAMYYADIPLEDLQAITEERGLEGAVCFASY